jgi:hypothetical protein
MLDLPTSTNTSWSPIRTDLPWATQIDAAPSFEVPSNPVPFSLISRVRRSAGSRGREAMGGGRLGRPVVLGGGGSSDLGVAANGLLNALTLVTVALGRVCDGALREHSISEQPSARQVLARNRVTKSLAPSLIALPAPAGCPAPSGRARPIARHLCVRRTARPALDRVCFAW